MFKLLDFMDSPSNFQKKWPFEKNLQKLMNRIIFIANVVILISVQNISNQMSDKYRKYPLKIDIDKVKRNFT